MTQNKKQDFIYGNLISLLILSPYITLLRYYIDLSLYFYILPILLIILIIELNRFNFNYSVNLKLIVFSLCACVLLIKEQGGYAYISYLIFLFIFILMGERILSIYKILIIQIIFLLTLSFISYIGYAIGIEYQGVYQDEMNTLFVYFFGVHHYQSFDLNPNSWRFYGFSNEPGLAAVFIMMILVIDQEKYKFKKITNILLWLQGILTFSTGFYIIMTTYFLLLSRKIIVKLLLLVCIGIFLFLTIPDQLNIAYDAVIANKIDNGSQELYERENLSIFRYLKFEEIPFGLFYFAMIFCLPSRLWPFFLILALYRHHFIFNMAPLLMALISSKLSNVQSN